MTDQSFALPTTGADRATIDDFVLRVLGELTLEEKVWMMAGHGFFEAYVAAGGVYNTVPYQTGGGNERLGLPALWFTDGPRGVAAGHCTCFPVAMARGASWDTDLEERIGEAMGREARAQGVNFFGGVCINLLRHPAWGRAQETYGEDPFHLGEMGAALVRGVQRHNVIAAIKHFAANSIENARFKVDVRIGERALREVYLPHFKRCVDEGVASVMSAYNKVRGHYCGHNAELLQTILKDEWGFEGFVHSDFVKGVYGPEAAAAGLDIENPEPIFFGPGLVAAVEDGRVARERIDDAVRRILTTLLAFAVRQDPEEYPKTVVASPAHRALAREAAEKSAVLLTNRDRLLPFDPRRLSSIALVGRLAAEENLGDRGSSLVRPPAVVTLAEGLRNHPAGGDRIDYVAEEDIAASARRAAAADLTVVVVGYTWRDEGEYIPGDMTLSGDADAPALGGDRASLDLLPEDEERILAVAAANPRTVVVVVAGSAVTMERWRQKPAAILLLWYPGMEGGNALARLLFGEAAPGGRLPFTMAAAAEDLPFFDRDADSIEYDLWHGYTLLERDGREPAFPFGFGLAYTEFRFDAPRVAVVDGRVRLEAEVCNIGERAGDAVAQLYVGPAEPRAEHPRKLLRGFRRFTLAPGEAATARFELDRDAFAHWDEARGGWTVEGGRRRAWIGASSRETDAVVVEFDLEG
jgi:beta-glucosidase